MGRRRNSVTASPSSADVGAALTGTRFTVAGETGFTCAHERPRRVGTVSVLAAVVVVVCALVDVRAHACSANLVVARVAVVTAAVVIIALVDVSTRRRRSRVVHAGVEGRVTPAVVGCALVNVNAPARRPNFVDARPEGSVATSAVVGRTLVEVFARVVGAEVIRAVVEGDVATTAIVDRTLVSVCPESEVGQRAVETSGRRQNR